MAATNQRCPLFYKHPLIVPPFSPSSLWGSLLQEGARVVRRVASKRPSFKNVLFLLLSFFLLHFLFSFCLHRGAALPKISRSSGLTSAPSSPIEYFIMPTTFEQTAAHFQSAIPLVTEESHVRIQKATSVLRLSGARGRRSETTYSSGHLGCLCTQT